MVKLLRAAALLFAVFFCAFAHSSQLREIQLRDGSVIAGQILQFDGRTYTVRSDSLGVVKLRGSDIRSISGAPDHRGRATVAAKGVSGADIQALQNAMARDHDIMALILSLQNDPAFSRLIKDPELMRKVLSGDLDALSRDPRMESLLRHPTVREIIGRTGH